jgi:hypothetical protein
MSLFAIEMQPALQVDELPAATGGYDGLQSSSYSTGDSAETVPMESEMDVAGGDWIGVVHDMKCALASVDATQVTICHKLELLQTAMVSVREDTSWVRGDVEAVHAILENLAEDVCLLGRTLREVHGVANDPPPDMSAWGAWGDPADGMADGIVERTEILEENRVQLQDEEPSHINVGRNAETSIDETCEFDMHSGVPGDVSTSMEASRVDGWLGNTGLSAVKWRGVGGLLQAMRNPPVVTDDGCEEMEQTLASTQTGTKAPGRSLWAEFSTAVRDIAPPGIGGGNNKEGWISSMRARGATVESGEGSNAAVGPLVAAGHGKLNLNLSPERRQWSDGMHMGGGTTSLSAKGPAGRGGGRGAGRGAGRGKRLPLVYPRFGSTASTLNLECFAFPLADCLFVVNAINPKPTVTGESCNTYAIVIVGHRSYCAQAQSAGCCIPGTVLNRWPRELPDARQDRETERKALPGACSWNCARMESRW